ncbi:MAG TPA: tRNA lysidine(34) synthetase TilS [Gemmatimonadaceae bacterium]|nr:tRNA lysidine(34) synthetase TilS [Gemmatimonadaceae bacterium]
MRITQRVRDESARALSPFPRVVIAASGGLDSMTLLDAVANTVPERISTVAVFDHRTGSAAQRAVAHVRESAHALGLPLRVGRAVRGTRPTEAAWRFARWSFLSALARDLDATVATGHTRDDHLETIFLRALRDSGARGLAALHAGVGVVRPLMSFTRSELAAYASAQHLEWVDDPSNASLTYARNRARLEILPTLERARPGLADSLLSLSQVAWNLRREVDEFIDANLPHTIFAANGSKVLEDAGSLVVARSSLATYDPDQLRVLWPALAARVGLALDRRGTERLATFTITGRPGARIQLSGRFEAVRSGNTLVLRRTSDGTVPHRSRAMTPALSLGGWEFRRTTTSVDVKLIDLWSALLPVRGGRVTVRAWRPGDRMVPHGASIERRLKGLFRDAGVDAARRRAWPIVLVDERIVWIPGVRRSSAATVRSGRPMALYRCERDDC